MAIDFARVRTTFEAVLEQPPAERAAWLAARCEDEALRREVEQLLASDASTTPMARLLDGSCDRFAGGGAPLRGATIGGFVVGELLGAGGMGSVYRASQREPRREVAFKVLTIGFADAHAVARFRFEAEVLARLRHPNIAQVHAAGVHAVGDVALPWFALELVPEARDVVAWAQQRALSTAARLALLLDVAEAVHHGHLQGVVHRDLKPANVLVGADGRVKVIDFGIARSLAPGGDGAQATERGVVVGTLAYMSPEQIAGGAVDHRTDVWSLGVLAFELLAGRPPLALAGATLLAAAARLQQGAPVLSSVARGLPRDLDAVLGKALRVRVAERYESVAAFAADLRAVLARQPVSARPPTIGYHLRRWVARHRAAAFGAAAVVLTIAAAVVALLVQNRELRQQQRQAARVAALVRQVLGEADVARERGPDYTVRAALDEAVRALDGEALPEPRVELELRMLLGDAYRGLGLVDAAVAQFTRAEPLARAGSGDDERAAIAAAISLAACRSTDASAWAQLVASATRALGADDAETLRARHEQARAARADGRLGDAEAAYRAVLAARERVLGGNAPPTIATLHNLGSLVLAAGRADEARELLEDCLRRSLAAGEGRVSTWQIADNLGEVRRELGDLDGAAAVHREAMAGFERLLGPDHELTIGCGYHLLKVLHRQRNGVALREVGLELLARCERTFGREHRRTMDVLAAVGIAHQQMGDHVAALEALARAFATQKANLGDAHPDAFLAGQNLAGAQLTAGANAAALATTRELVARLPEAERLRPVAVGHTQLLHARALEANGEHAAAAAAAAAARETLQPHVPAEHALLRQALEVEARTVARRGG